MSKRSTYLLLLFIVIILIAGCGDNKDQRKLPDLRESYSHTDKKPFGTYIAYRELEEMFYRNTIRDEKRNFEDSWKSLADTGCIYICIGSSIYTTYEDAESMINFVKNGNDVFLAGQEFDNSLLEKLECKTTYSLPASSFVNQKPYRATRAGIKEAGPADTSFYRYFYVPFANGFSAFNTANTRVLGVNEYGAPNFIVIFKGKGRIFMHCDPRAFSNYFLLQQNNYEYLQKAFGYLRAYPDHVYWNDYYIKLRSRAQAESRRNNGDDNNFSSFSELLSHPSLAIAFWLTVLLLLLYILFTMKRRQRVIEMVKPNENTTVTFTETIGRLYLQKKDNKNIADKMITYFNEYIRNNYFLNSNQVNSAFMSTLSRKSGVPFEQVETLYRAISHAHQSNEIDDYQLLSLNEQIQNFYKTRN